MDDAAREAEREVRLVEGRLVAAVLARDAGALREILADDLVFVTPFGDVYGKRVMAEIDREDAPVTESVEIDDLVVRVYGEAAVVTGRAAVRSRLAGRDLGGLFRYTRVYARRPGAWQLVSYQATRVAGEG